MKINVARTKTGRGDGWKGDEKGVIEQNDRAKRVAHRCQANKEQPGHGRMNGRGNQLEKRRWRQLPEIAGK